MKAGKYLLARDKYTLSIAAFKADPAAYSNRALCAFKAGEVPISSRRSFMMNTRAQGKLLHTWIILVIIWSKSVE